MAKRVKQKVGTVRKLCVLSDAQELESKAFFRFSVLAPDWAAHLRSRSKPTKCSSFDSTITVVWLPGIQPLPALYRGCSKSPLSYFPTSGGRAIHFPLCSTANDRLRMPYLIPQFRRDVGLGGAGAGARADDERKVTAVTSGMRPTTLSLCRKLKGRWSREKHCLRNHPDPKLHYSSVYVVRQDPTKVELHLQWL